MTLDREQLERALRQPCRRATTRTDTVTLRAPSARARVDRLREAEGLDSRSAALHWLLLGWEERELRRRERR